MTILASSFVLTITLGIIKGFETIIEERMQNIYPSLVIYAPDYESFNYPELEAQLLHLHGKEIQALAPGHSKQVVVTREQKEPIVITLKSVVPEKESHISSIETKLIKNKSLADALKKPNAVIIGKQLAEHFEIEIGDTITILFSEEAMIAEKTSFNSCSLEITNIMDTGIMHYDLTTGLISQKTMANVFNDDAITLVGIKNNATTDVETLHKKLKATHTFDIFSWKNLYPALMETIVLQKKISWLLIAFIMFLSCTSIASLIFMHIQHKWYDLGLLKLLGASNTTITLLILMITVSITLPSLIAGLITAAIIGIAIDRYALITLSDEFLFSHVPVHFTPAHFYGIFMIIVGISLIIGLLCARSAYTINSTTLLRFKE